MTLLKLSNIVNTHLKKQLPLSSCTTLVDMHLKEYNYQKSKHFLNTIPFRYSIDFNPYGYRRIPVHDLDHMELLLLEWKPEAFSPIHDHHDNGCIMVLLENILLEKRHCIKNDTIENEMYLPLQQAQYIDNSLHYHSIYNTSTKKTALSLHLYPK